MELKYGKSVSSITGVTIGDGHTYNVTFRNDDWLVLTVACPFRFGPTAPSMLGNDWIADKVQTAVDQFLSDDAE